jgi:hypothetical protein
MVFIYMASLINNCAPVASQAWTYTWNSLRSGVLPGLALIIAPRITHTIARYFYPELEEISPIRKSKLETLSSRQFMISNLIIAIAAYIIAKAFHIAAGAAIATTTRNRIGFLPTIAAVLGPSFVVLFAEKIPHFLRKTPNDRSQYSSYWRTRTHLFQIINNAYALHYGFLPFISTYMLDSSISIMRFKKRPVILIIPSK